MSALAGLGTSIGRYRCKEVAFALRKRLEQILRTNRKRFRQLDDVLQGDVPLASLDATDVIAMQASSLRQLLLGISTVLSQGS